MINRQINNNPSTLNHLRNNILKLNDLSLFLWNWLEMTFSCRRFLVLITEQRTWNLRQKVVSKITIKDQSTNILFLPKSNKLLIFETSFVPVFYGSVDIFSVISFFLFKIEYCGVRAISSFSFASLSSFVDSMEFWISVEATIGSTWTGTWTFAFSSTCPIPGRTGLSEFTSCGAYFVI